MSILRRYKLTGHSYFITSVTYQRNPILTQNINFFWQACENTLTKTSFEIIAHVILPDHFHMVLDVPKDDFTNVIQRIKMSFGSYYRRKRGLQSGRVWQHRFWDHIIRDEEDLNNHMDYIHFNPVKHSLTTSPFEWQHSSIHRYAKDGIYEKDWGNLEELSFSGEFGE